MSRRELLPAVHVGKHVTPCWLWIDDSITSFPYRSPLPVPKTIRAFSHGRPESIGSQSSVPLAEVKAVFCTRGSLNISWSVNEEQQHIVIHHIN